MSDTSVSGGRPRVIRGYRRIAAHGGHVADVGGDGFPAQIAPRSCGGGEVYAVHHGVRGVQLGNRAIRECDSSGIIAIWHGNSELSLKSEAGFRFDALSPLPDQFDQAEFTEVGDAHFQKLATLPK